MNRIHEASWGRRVLWLLAGLFAIFLLIQLFPYGRDHTNPPVTSSPKFVGAQTQQLFETSCGDCHSNLTEWRWYSNLAPASWLVQSDVDEGREKMNFSNWDQPQPDIGELVEQIDEGEMPPGKYTLLHSNAKLSATERATLVKGLTATYATDPPGGIKGD